MHRVIAGCNLWAIGFLAAALVMGVRGDPGHVAVGLFASVFALLAQCACFMLFMGASKLLKEHVAIYALPGELIDRTNAIMLPLFRWATAGSLALLALAILGGLTLSGDVPAAVHVAAAVATIALLAVAVPREVRGFAAMHDLLAGMEAGLPAGPAPGPGRAAAAAPDPERAADLAANRWRALAYVGASAVAMALGYRYISGLPVPDLAVGLALAFGAACLAGAAAIALRARSTRG